jgi:hypothetical protein
VISSKAAIRTRLPPPPRGDMAAVLFGRDNGETSTMRTLLGVVLATVTFLVFFYSTTIAMSLMYALDSAVLRF